MLETGSGALTGATDGKPVPAAPITVNVTKPDGNTDILQAVTDVNGVYTLAPQTYTIAGQYSAVANYPGGDGVHDPGTSSAFTFTVTVLQPVVLTLTFTAAPAASKVA